ncbi:hypothetical protein [Polaribacter sp. R77954]|uniref:hypothetical protein n=1 Tax=Polaribacter sp. R77954 TaxID=3093870 RepID=UPI0037C54E23
MKKLIIAAFTFLFIATGCQQKPKTNKASTVKPIEKNLSEKIENAHQKKAFLKNEAIRFDAAITFGGKEIFNANITITTASDLAKITYKDGNEIYVNQQNIFVSPNLKENPGVRFHAYTWSYFFLFPYKLNDNGTEWDFNFNTKETKNPLNTAKLSFKANTGDAPDDWYITYSNNNNVLQHVAYIVTSGKTKAEAEADPHAIKYINYKNINGIPFASQWEFYEWNLNDGLTNKIGTGNITNIQFVKDFRANFSIPKDYIKK